MKGGVEDWATKELGHKDRVPTQSDKHHLLTASPDTINSTVGHVLWNALIDQHQQLFTIAVPIQQSGPRYQGLSVLLLHVIPAIQMLQTHRSFQSTYPSSRIVVLL